MSALAAAKTSNATIKWLAAPTSDAWLEQAIAHPLELLIDHAHCERKAAGAVVQ
ncbi:MAG: tRNA isopentenyl-2-thiomethyl-A-37 hydroxylase MiaE, partial [Cyanobacteriota bacterium]|nr:tRNA isopentenyl-2-thiomethyl-A-37 hydroxylase MiaE [Cyanobacteriota bacterium]